MDGVPGEDADSRRQDALDRMKTSYPIVGLAGLGLIFGLRASVQPSQTLWWVALVAVVAIGAALGWTAANILLGKRPAKPTPKGMVTSVIVLTIAAGGTASHALDNLGNPDTIMWFFGLCLLSMAVAFYLRRAMARFTSDGQDPK